MQNCLLQKASLFGELAVWVNVFFHGTADEYTKGSERGLKQESPGAFTISISMACRFELRR